MQFRWSVLRASMHLFDARLPGCEDKQHCFCTDTVPVEAVISQIVSRSKTADGASKIRPFTKRLGVQCVAYADDANSCNGTWARLSWS